jgi:hypothetical protein
MQGVFLKLFVTIISGLSLPLTYSFIDNRFEIRSGYTHTNEMNFSQESYKKSVKNTFSCQMALSHKADRNPYKDKEKIKKIFGTDKSAFQNLSLEEIERQINSFFTYLDQQQYVEGYKSVDGTQRQFHQIFEIITVNPPVVPRETDSIHDVLKNFFYFYRILSKERIILIKDILTNESDIIEPLMHTFYRWFRASNNQNSESELPQLSIEQIYIYACFFLETFGGRNYLFRRDPKVRILTSYYCVRIIDQANIEGVNSNGIDIRPHLELVFKDLTDQIGFIFKNQYFMELEKLRKKYKLS